jgi:hypothetical protein
MVSPCVFEHFCSHSARVLYRFWFPSQPPYWNCLHVPSLLSKNQRVVGRWHEPLSSGSLQNSGIQTIKWSLAHSIAGFLSVFHLLCVAPRAPPAACTVSNSPLLFRSCWSCRRSRRSRTACIVSYPHCRTTC